MTKPLTGKTALVTGATRGGGRGTALALAEAGAFVWCTGRSTTGAPASGRPETIDETVALIGARGGQATAVRVDHTVPAEVEALAARVKKESGRLDVLVNDIWGGDALVQWGTKPWEIDVAKTRTLWERAVFTHIVTNRYLLPLVIDAKGLVVEVGDGSGLWYREQFEYDLVKISVMRIAYTLSRELKEHGVCALSITPGFLRSEAMLDHFGVTESTWRDAIKQDEHYAQSETPAYLGRAIAALAADPNVLQKTGKALDTGSLAQEYGFTDVDGRTPNWNAYFQRVFPGKLVHAFGP